MVDPASLRREWEAFSLEWIARSESRADAAREGLLDEWMLDVVGDVSGLDVVDLGCGEGRFCRMLAARGARTVGVDLQSGFIDYATSKAGPAETYRVGDIQDLSGVPDASFDLAVSYISLVDVPDQKAAVAEAFRVLAPEGRFVVCNLSPMATAWMEVGPLASGSRRQEGPLRPRPLCNRGGTTAGVPVGSGTDELPSNAEHDHQ